MASESLDVVGGGSSVLGGMGPHDLLQGDPPRRESEAEPRVPTGGFGQVEEIVLQGGGR